MPHRLPRLERRSANQGQLILVRPCKSTSVVWVHAILSANHAFAMKSSGPKIIIKPRLARSSVAAATSEGTAIGTPSNSSARTSTPSRPPRRAAASAATTTPKTTRRPAPKQVERTPEIESGEEELESEFTQADERGEASDVVMADGEDGDADMDGASAGVDRDGEEDEHDDEAFIAAAAAATPTPALRGRPRPKGGRAGVAQAGGGRAGSVSGSVASGSASGAGTSTPRGRAKPKGTTKARGPGAGAGAGRSKGAKGTAVAAPASPLTIRLPGRAEEDAEREASEVGRESPAVGGTEEVVEEKEKEKEKEKEVPMGGGKPFRKIQGNVYVIENDEFVTDDDPKGDTKIDSNGNLLGGVCQCAAHSLLTDHPFCRPTLQGIDFPPSEQTPPSSVYARDRRCTDVGFP